MKDRLASVIGKNLSLNCFFRRYEIEYHPLIWSAEGGFYQITARDQIRPRQHRENGNDHNLPLFLRILPQALAKI